jgi:hypothetical protein
MFVVIRPKISLQVLKLILIWIDSCYSVPVDNFLPLRVVDGANC